MIFGNWVWAFLAAIVSTIYFFLIKDYVEDKNPYTIFTVIMLELLVIYLYYKSLEHTRSGIIYAIINGFSVILGLLISIHYFKESISIIDILGVLLIVIGIMMVGKK